MGVYILALASIIINALAVSRSRRSMKKDGAEIKGKCDAVCEKHNKSKFIMFRKTLIAQAFIVASQQKGVCVCYNQKREIVYFEGGYTKENKQFVAVDPREGTTNERVAQLISSGVLTPIK